MFVTIDELKQTAKPAAFRSKGGKKAEVYAITLDTDIETPHNGTLKAKAGDTLLIGKNDTYLVLDRDTFGAFFEALKPATDVTAPFNVRGRA